MLNKNLTNICQQNNSNFWELCGLKNKSKPIHGSCKLNSLLVTFGCKNGDELKL